MTAKCKLAIFASGNGSNFSALVEELKEQADVEIKLLVCDQAQAYVLERGKATGVPTLLVSLRDFSNRQAYEEAILAALHEAEIDLIVLAGYLKIIGPTLLTAYGQRIINIHPSLLPAYPGLNSIAAAFEAGEQTTGVTIHYVDEGLDSGPLIRQEAVPITPGETLASLTAKVHQVEHRLYPQVIREIIALQKGNQDEKSPN